MKKFDLQSSPGFLVARVTHQLNVHIRKFIAEAGIQLSAKELAILTALAQLDSKKNMGKLAELFGRDQSTLNRQLNGLVKTGLDRKGNSRLSWRKCNSHLSSQLEIEIRGDLSRRPH